MYKEQILAATKEENNHLKTELDHARQVAQQSSDLEAGRIVALALAAKKEAMKAKEAKVMYALLH